MEETERSLHDAIMIVRRALKVSLRCAALLIEKDQNVLLLYLMMHISVVF